MTWVSSQVVGSKRMTNNSAPSSVFNIPEMKLSSSSGHWRMPIIGFGCGVDNLDEDAVKIAVLEAIKLVYRHFDTVSIYGTRKALGEAIAEALGLVSSREELFVTSKLWCKDAHPDLVVPALKKSLRTLQMQYLDLYLIHWPLSAKPADIGFSIHEDNFLPMDYKGVWEAMEDCQKLGLTKSIGVSNFSSRKIETLLSFAAIPPSFNQVEMNPVWQQRKLREFCQARGIIVTAYSPLGAVGNSWGSNEVMENESLKHIAKAHGIAQVSLRWIVEQGAIVVVKSFNKERLIENLGIFDWVLNDDDYDKINQIPQHRIVPRQMFVSPHGPFKTLEELWAE